MPDAPLDTPSPLRLALVITGLDVGGAEKCLTQLATHLDRSRYRPVVYSLQPPPAGEKAALVEQLEASGIEIHFLNARSYGGFLRVLGQLARLLRRQSPRLVQTFLYHANIVGTLAARMAGVKTVVTGLRVAEDKPYRQRLERAAASWSRAHVAVSNDVAEFYRRRGFSQNKLVVIPNGVDLDAYRSATAADLSAEGISPSRRVILYVGRLDEAQKGIVSFVKNIRPLLDQAQDADLVLIGDGPDRGALEAAIAQLGRNAGRVHLLGWRSDVPQLLKRASVVVLPSRYEGMPNAVLESLAAGVPVVASRAEGTKEIFGDRFDECTFAWNDYPAWHQRILEVLRSPESGSPQAQWAQERLESKFSVSSMVAAYERLWQQLISETAA